MTLGSVTNQHSKPAMTEILSPCIGVCTLAPNGLCVGCLRSSEEIGKWLTYTAVDRARIMLELPQRLESLFAL